jgi:hypothetical protein
VAFSGANFQVQISFGQFFFILLDYRIGFNFWKVYLIRTGFTLGEPVALVKVFRLLRSWWIVCFGVHSVDTVGRCTILAGPACLWCLVVSAIHCLLKINWTSDSWSLNNFEINQPLVLTSKYRPFLGVWNFFKRTGRFCGIINKELTVEGRFSKPVLWVFFFENLV